MNRVAALTISFLPVCCHTVLGQDVMQYGVKHLTVTAASDAFRRGPRRRGSNPGGIQAIAGLHNRHPVPRRAPSVSARSFAGRVSR